MGHDPHRTPRAALWLLLLAGPWLPSGCDGCQPRPKGQPATLPAPRAAAAVTWRSIPGGAFTMGRDHGDDDEAPAHRVALPAFKMARTETTVTQYQRCVEAGACDSPRSGGRCNWGRPRRQDHPLNCVSLEQARRFCRWAGGRLPTEAEWEYAARSGESRRYPWGDQLADCSRAVMDHATGPGCGRGSTWPACSRSPAGDSLQGLCDLAGNVWEWVADCWHGDYRGAPADGTAWTTVCKDGGSRQVVRGSSWHVGTADDLRAATRDSSPASGQYFGIGFRCARAAASNAGVHP